MVRATERVSAKYYRINSQNPAEILSAMLKGQAVALKAVQKSAPAIIKAALAMKERLQKDGRIIYAGAGTPGRLGVQDSAELPPTFSWPKERLLVLIAGGKKALNQSVEGAEDNTEIAAKLIRHHRIGKKDILIAVSASGTTPFTLACLRESKKRGALTVGISNNRGAPVLKASHYSIFLNTGPEPIAGSTRMNSGTAQRMTLTLLSSLVMVLLGGVYQGRMVGVGASCEKLDQRSKRITKELTGRSVKEVSEALRRGENVKVATLLLKGCRSVGEANKFLKRTRGHLGPALRLVEQWTARQKASNTPARKPRN